MHNTIHSRSMHRHCTPAHQAFFPAQIIPSPRLWAAAVGCCQPAHPACNTGHTRACMTQHRSSPERMPQHSISQAHESLHTVKIPATRNARNEMTARRAGRWRSCCSTSGPARPDAVRRSAWACRWQIPTLLQAQPTDLAPRSCRCDGRNQRVNKGANNKRERGPKTNARKQGLRAAALQVHSSIQCRVAKRLQIHIAVAA